MSNPSDCLEISPFRFGPVPAEGGVFGTPPHPDSHGYGGSDYGVEIYGNGFFKPAGNVWVGGYGMSPSGADPYGNSLYPAPSFAIAGGYGGDPYGLSGQGSIELEAPYVTGALSINGTHIEVFFSEPMDLRNPALLDVNSYRIDPVVGGQSSIVSVSAGMRTVATDLKAQSVDGVNSVILSHTGTMLGGVYKISVVSPDPEDWEGAKAPSDISGNPIVVPQTIPPVSGDIISTPLQGSTQTNSTVVLTVGVPPSYTVTPVSGSELEVEFSTPMLGEADFSPGIETPSAYSFQSEENYPIQPTALSVHHPYQGDSSKLILTVKGMTSLNYLSEISPAKAIDFDGTYVPSDAEDFEAIEEGVGTSAAGSLLSLSKEAGDFYGWVFADTTGKIVPSTSTYQTEISFDLNGTEVQGGLIDGISLATFVVDDGHTSIELKLLQSGGNDVLSIHGVGEIPVEWSDGNVHTVSVLRNKKAQSYVFLYDGRPLVTAKEVVLAQPGGFSGVGVILSPDYAVSGFHVRKVAFSATNTIYSQAWNFLHGIKASFLGSNALTKDHLLTQRGPLVKGWGDATPATKQDVQVKINDTPVEVSLVNPYFGKVHLTVPVPLMPPEDIDVQVDYKWFQTPVMGMEALNTRGLVLNKWDRSNGHNTPENHGQQVQDLPKFPKGAPDISRFPMGVVLGPVDRPEPLYVGHRYLGVERDYSATLNNPKSLLLNQNPNAIAVDNFETTPEGAVIRYEGLKTPEDMGWELRGFDQGALDFGSGTYTLLCQNDPNDGSLSSAFTTTYTQAVDLSFDSTVSIHARLHADADQIDLHGVFTGVGFGVHDNRRVWSVGLLQVDTEGHNAGVEPPIKHVGMLLNSSRPDLDSSWRIGPTSFVTIDVSEDGANNVMLTYRDRIPEGIEEGSRFRIQEGPQAGIYTVDSLIYQQYTPPNEGVVTIYIKGEFPVSPKELDARDMAILWETDWEKPQTYSMTIDSTNDWCHLRVSGPVFGTAFVYAAKAASITIPNGDLTAAFDNKGSIEFEDVFYDEDGLPVRVQNPLATPNDYSLLFSTGGEGQVFWGSLSRHTSNASTWSFLRYGSIPDRRLEVGRDVVVANEFGRTPDLDYNYEWFNTQSFGSSVEDVDQIYLSGTASSKHQDFTYGFSRIEPFLDTKAKLDIDCRFVVDSSTSPGDAQVVLQDTRRQVVLGNLAFIESAGTRKLVTLPHVSLSGLFLPHLDPSGEWSRVEDNFTDYSNHRVVGSSLVTQHNDLELYSRYTASLEAKGNVGSLLDFRLRLDRLNPDIEAGVYVSVDVVDGDVLRELSIEWVNGGVFINEDSFPAVWEDEESHSYRLLINSVTREVVFLFDYKILGTVDFDNLEEIEEGSAWSLSFGHSGGQGQAVWDSLYLKELPPLDAVRTLGVWKGGDKDDIDSWELPRTDSFQAPNSSLAVPVGQDGIIEMDWRSPLDVRIHQDPLWGVTVLRPDLPPPPYWDKMKPDGHPKGDWVSSVTDPSAGWINVEYRFLPKVSKEVLGSVSFGALRRDSLSHQKWDYFRYRIYNHPTEDYRSPDKMVLNQYNVITSGEILKDVTPEILTIHSMDKKRVSLLPSRNYASRIYRLLVDGAVVSATNWSFDPDSQMITLGVDADGNEIEFSEDHQLVTVVYRPGFPVTSSYLENQPLQDSGTLLNEGTPPVPKNQITDPLRKIVFGSQLNDPMDTLNEDADFVLNDPHKAVVYEDAPDSLYENMEFLEIDNGGETGLIRTIGEGTLPIGESGWFEDEGDDYISGHLQAIRLLIGSDLAAGDSLTFYVPVQYNGDAQDITLKAVNGQANNTLTVSSADIAVNETLTVTVPIAAGGPGVGVGLVARAAPVHANEFELVVGDDAQTAANIAAVINTPFVVDGVTADVVGNIISLSVDQIGDAGNLTTLIDSSVGSGFGISSGNFQGGSDLGEQEFNIALPTNPGVTAGGLAALLQDHVSGLKTTVAGPVLTLKTNLPKISLDYPEARVSVSTFINGSVLLNGSAISSLDLRYIPGLSDLVKSPTERVGRSAGSHALEYKGTQFSDSGVGIPQPVYSQGGGMPGHILLASGGNTNLGGNLGKNAVMFPTFPSIGVSGNTESGAVFKRTYWDIRLSSVVRDALAPESSTENLSEFFSLPQTADNVPPTAHASDYFSPNGDSGGNNHGSCFIGITQTGDYSRIGPWGGIDSLVPGVQEQIGPEIGGMPVSDLALNQSSLLYGSGFNQPTGVPTSGSGMILQGGASLPKEQYFSFLLDTSN